MDSLYGYKEQFLRPCEVVCGCVRVCVWGRGGWRFKGWPIIARPHFFHPLPCIIKREEREKKESLVPDVECGGLL